jgi:chromosome partitioning protein
MRSLAGARGIKLFDRSGGCDQYRGSFLEEVVSRMGVIVFASLKGGVGKTSLSVNVAHSFAKRRCRTLLIDLDPAGHTTRFFRVSNSGEAPLARYLFEFAKDGTVTPDEYITHVRPDLDLMPSGEELRHFLWGRGHQLFSRAFPKMLKQLRMDYDHVVIDTPPDFNPLTRYSLASADVAIVPVDASEMSIYSLEELLLSAQHLSRPTWGIVRTMVNRKASRSRMLSSERLQERLEFQQIEEIEQELDEEFDVEDPNSFVQMLQTWEKEHSPKKDKPLKSDKPIYLLRSLLYRTESQNQLTFTGKTALDARQTSSLAEQYLSVAKEVESMLAAKEEEGALVELPFDEQGESLAEDSPLELHA